MRWLSGYAETVVTGIGVAVGRSLIVAVGRSLIVAVGRSLIVAAAEFPLEDFSGIMLSLSHYRLVLLWLTLGWLHTSIFINACDKHTVVTTVICLS